MSVESQTGNVWGTIVRVSLQLALKSGAESRPSALSGGSWAKDWKGDDEM